MRLSQRMIDVIRDAVNNSFGRVDVYLFGSRTDESKKGGDIDIAIDSKNSRDEFKKNRLKFIVFLLKMGYDFKIDVVEFNHLDPLFKDEIMNTAIKIA